MSDIVNRMTIRVGPVDIDSYNIVHHPQYLIWCEKAILQWMEEYAPNKERYKRNIYRYVVKKFECKFCNPAEFDDELQICVKAIKKDLTKDMLSEDRENWKFHIRIENAATKARVIDGEFEIRIFTCDTDRKL